jgi:hypothetical protein
VSNRLRYNRSVSDLLQHYQNVKSELQVLRGSVAGLPGAEEFLKLFDEFVREYEFGLALEIVCDRLLDPAVTAPTAEVVSRIGCIT